MIPLSTPVTCRWTVPLSLNFHGESLEMALVMAFGELQEHISSLFKSGESLLGAFENSNEIQKLDEEGPCLRI